MNSKTESTLNKYLLIQFISTVVILLLIAIGISCSKNPNPTEPLPDDPPIEVPCDTVFVEVEIPVPVPTICDTVDVTVGFIAKIDQSFPNDYLLQVVGFPDETVTITETRPTPTDTTIVREYKGFVVGGKILFTKKSGSRAEAVGVFIVEQKCSE